MLEANVIQSMDTYLPCKWRRPQVQLAHDHTRTRAHEYVAQRMHECEASPC